MTPETEHNTQLPTSGKLCGESKWEVDNAERWVVRKAAPHIWGAFQLGSRRETIFLTWREAVDYVYQQSRTVEVTLPHLSASGSHLVDHIDFDPVTITHHPHQIVKLALGKWEGIGLTYAELEPVALYLLALHYQQEVPE